MTGGPAPTPAVLFRDVGVFSLKEERGMSAPTDVLVVGDRIAAIGDRVAERRAARRSHRGRCGIIC